MISEKLRARGRSFRHAFDGIFCLWKEEPNTRIHLFFTVAAVFCGFFFRISMTEWLAVILLVGGVWSAETFNSAIERCVDLTTTEKHPLAKAAKDLAAGAVLLLAFTSVVVGVIIFLPKFLALFFI